MTHRLVSLSVISVLVWSGHLLAQDTQVATAEKATANPSGTWKWERDLNGNVVKFTLQLKYDNEKVSGTFKSEWPEGGPPGLSDPVEISNAKLDGDNLTFDVKRSFNDNEFVVHYSGKIDGDKIAGNQEFEFGNGPQKIDWTPTRFVDYAAVVGKWKLKFQGPNGDAIEPTIHFSKDGEKLKGTYHSTIFGDNEIKNIRISDQTLTFDVTFNTDQGGLTLKYKAEPSDDKISGSISGDAGGQAFEIPFDGVRESKESEAPNP